MEQTLPKISKPKPPSLFKKMLEWVTENPVIIKELRKRMRQRRTFVLVFIYVLVVSAFTILLYWITTLDAGNSQWEPSFRQTLGQTIFGTVVISELLLVIFISPALTTGAITTERELQTYELLRTTLLSAPALVFGKLGSSFIFIVLLIFATIPIQSLAFLLGGVGMAELLIASLMLVVTAFYFSSMGILFSSIAKRTTIANVLTYGTILGTTIVFGIVAIVILATYSSYSYANTSPFDFTGFAAEIVLYAIICTNPLLAAIVSESILIDSQSLFYINQSLFGGNISFFLSPWIPFTLVYLLLAFVMLGASILFVNRPES